MGMRQHAIRQNMSFRPHDSSPLQEFLQVVAGQQGGVLRPFQEGADVVADGLHVQGRQPLPRQRPPGPRVPAAGPKRLVQRVLQKRQIERYRRTLGETPHQIVPVPPLNI